ncbi:uncharacterized protein N7483_008025 [Penicillium malachiteum]|uniref:uncharacterized protein n=1 Tax=Penicillium malachiteum TaxID=1324776 RepID=UPI0025473D4B|nr:uncharacterized protein N7483_008025 [Penicillium malachiteum]KAJ5726668.1 hypothetical protein N7483_008025 [Penicillium malachiteum]
MESVSFDGENNGLQIAKNEGPITANFYPLERPETPPSPLSTIPFLRNVDFVSRDKPLRQIREKCSVPGSRIALVGLGGVGRKSQLAIEYSYRIRTESPATWVLWVHASNEARFEQSLRAIADQLKIPGHLDPKVNIYKLIEKWLYDEKKGKWICILDNADDYEFLCSLPAAGKGALAKPLLEYIPKSQNGSLIIISRSREATLKMVAVSHIRNRAPRCSVSLYLREFQVSDCKATKLLEREIDCLDRDWEVKNSILVTWQILFNYIRRKKKLIRPYFEAGGTYTSELYNGLTNGEISESDIGPDFEDDITILRDYSFISTNKTGTSFMMHRLIQLTTQAWLKSYKHIDQ